MRHQEAHSGGEASGSSLGWHGSVGRGYSGELKATGVAVTTHCWKENSKRERKET